MNYNFWIGNKLDMHHTKSAEEIASGFVASEMFQSYEQGWPLERALSVYTAYAFGSNDISEFRNMIDEIKAIIDAKSL